MNGLIFSLCRTMYLISMMVALSAVSQAGILEDLSQAAKATHTLSSCPEYNSREAHMALTQAALCEQQTNTTGLSKQGLNLSKIQEKIETNVEDRYFATLATQHSNELVCASQFAEKIQAGDAQADQVLKPLFRDLRTFKLALNEATENITKNPQVSLKVCPVSIIDLQNDFPDKKSRQEPNYLACAQLISTRTSYQAVLASIPLAQFPSAQAALSKYSTSKTDLSDSELEKLIHSTYKNAKSEILKQAQDIRDKAKSQGGSAFSRSDRHALLADPRLTEKVLTDGGNSAALKAVACAADARYGSGADDLDNGLFFGSMAVSGGLVIKAAGSAMKMATAANAGRALGVFSWNTANILRTAAIAGMQGTAAWNGIEKACFDSTVKMKATTTNSCSDAPTVEKLQQDNCVLASTLAAMDVAPIAAVAKLTEAQNKMAAALKGRALEAKIAARRAAIAERNADKAPSTSAPTVTPKKGVTVVQTDAPASTSGTNLTTNSQLNVARANKEKEKILAAKEKQAAEMRAAGMDEYDINFKLLRDEELAHMKADGLYTTKAPTGTTFENGSLIKGGKGPFESKAGDLNLITEEQLKQLERHNPGTVVYNYKTGEELVIGLDDFDKELLKLKVGGKFSQWGFKVAP